MIGAAHSGFETQRKSHQKSKQGYQTLNEMLWFEIGTGTRAYCFLLCQVCSLYCTCVGSLQCELDGIRGDEDVSLHIRPGPRSALIRVFGGRGDGGMRGVGVIFWASQTEKSQSNKICLNFNFQGGAWG